MKAVGYALLLSALIGGGIFLSNLLSGMASEQCNRNCPGDRNALVTVFDFGFVVYKDCRCK